MREESTLRDRQAELETEADRIDAQGGPLPGPMLVETKTVGTYPTSPKSYFAAKVIDPGGAECEGCAGTFAAGTETLFALNAGSSVPPAGTQVIVDPIGGRWVFIYNG